MPPVTTAPTVIVPVFDVLNVKVPVPPFVTVLLNANEPVPAICIVALLPPMVNALVVESAVLEVSDNVAVLAPVPNTIAEVVLPNVLALLTIASDGMLTVPALIEVVPV